MGWLWRMRRKGVPIIFRLDGISWIHKKKHVGFVKFLKAEYRNFTCKLIHAFLTDHVVYQSQFVKEWWDRAGWKKHNQFTIIHNGVDLEIFSPDPTVAMEKSIVFLEGKVDYSPYAVGLIKQVVKYFKSNVPVRIYGGFEDVGNKRLLEEITDLEGSIPLEMVPEALQNGVYISLDIHPACPNTVAESMANGMPVVAYDTGSIKELVADETGIVVPYGSDPWLLKTPDYNVLIKAIEKALDNWSHYSTNARKHAEEYFNIDKVVKQYLQVIKNQIN